MLRCSFPPSAHKDSLWNKSAPRAENSQNSQDRIGWTSMQLSIWSLIYRSHGENSRFRYLDNFLSKAKSEGWRLLNRNHVPNPQVYWPLLWENYSKWWDGSLDPRSACGLHWKICIKYVVSRAPMRKAMHLRTLQCLTCALLLRPVAWDYRVVEISLYQVRVSNLRHFSWVNSSSFIHGQEWLEQGELQTQWAPEIESCAYLLPEVVAPLCSRFLTRKTQSENG
jgi:hypothetical protein